MTFNVRITFSIAARSSDSLNVLVDAFQITFKDSCADDQIYLGTNNLGEVDYFIDSGQSTINQVDFTQDISGCPIAYKLEVYNPATLEF